MAVGDDHQIEMAEQPSEPHQREADLRRRRITRESGSYNVRQTNVPICHRLRHCNLLMMLVDMQWQWLLLVITVVFVVTFVIFAGLWLAVSKVQVTVSDAGSGSGVGGGTGNDSSPLQTVPCVQNVDDFLSALLFSVEVQDTLG